MDILVVDDEQYMLDDIVEILEKIEDVNKIYAYTDPYEGLLCAQKEKLQVALLDVKMYDMNGIEMARRLKKVAPEIYIIFLTGDSTYAIDAFKIHARGYLMKPTTQEELEEELKYAKREVSRINHANEAGKETNQIEQSLEPTQKQRIRIQTFGYFEVFYNGRTVVFQSNKSKELLAFLVDRKGAEVTMAELADTLWEEHENEKNAKSYVRRAISKLLEVLKENHCEGIISKSRNKICVIPEKFDCDYYEFIKGDVRAINSFTGEYMSNYSWAEFTAGFLDAKIKNKGYIENI